MSNTPFVIKKMNLFSSWVFNLPKNTECTICRCSLNGPSLYHQEKGIDSYVVSGICQHSFHNECIKPWVEKNKLCPICTQKWEFSKSNITTKYDLSDDDLPALISPKNDNMDKDYDIIKQKMYEKKYYNSDTMQFNEELIKNKDDILKEAAKMINDLKNNFVENDKKIVDKVIDNSGNKMEIIKKYIQDVKSNMNSNNEDKKINIIKKNNIEDELNKDLESSKAIEPPKTPEKKISIKTMNNTDKMISIFKEIDESIDPKVNLYKTKLKNIIIDKDDIFDDEIGYDSYDDDKHSKSSYDSVEALKKKIKKSKISSSEKPEKKTKKKKPSK